MRAFVPVRQTTPFMFNACVASSIERPSTKDLDTAANHEHRSTRFAAPGIKRNLPNDLGPNGNGNDLDYTYNHFRICAVKRCYEIGKNTKNRNTQKNVQSLFRTKRFWLLESAQITF